MKTLLLVFLVFFASRMVVASNLVPPLWMVELPSQILLDLASSSYRAGQIEDAKKYLRQLLKIDPSHHDGTYFLGMLYLMEGNVEAALKYWNRIREPRIRNVRMEPSSKVDSALLDRAFVISPASVLRLDEYLETKSRLDSTGAFRHYELQLKPLEENRSFDVMFRAQTRKGITASPVKIAVILAEAILEKRARPAFYNIGNTTASFTSTFSWDEYRNRVVASISLPLRPDPHSRLRVFTDNRFETWVSGSEINLRKSEAGLELSCPSGGRSKWMAGTSISHRQFVGDLPDFNSSGWQMKVFGGYDVTIFSVPERRFSITSHTNASIGRNFESGAQASVTQALSWEWFPQPSEEDLSYTGRLGVGKILGSPGLDDLFYLGADRSDNLMLRAHRSRMDQLGENPFSSAYVLLNTELSKILYRDSLIRLRITPFIDVARIAKNPLWERDVWFVDTGVEAGLQFMRKAELRLTYGKDLQTGRNVFYVGASL